ncbi:hypothetical protein T484DRAFT_1808522, partial [Baffinella frigidus]
LAGKGSVVTWALLFRVTATRGLASKGGDAALAASGVVGLASKGGDVALAALFRVANSKIDHIWLSKDVPPEGAFPALAALFRVANSKIDHVWLSKDVPPEGAFPGKEALVSSDLWSRVLAVTGESAGKSDTDRCKEALVSSDLWSRVLAVAGESAGRGPTFHFNDYASQVRECEEDALGLGLGSTSTAVSWRRPNIITFTAVEQVPASAYGGSSKNLKNLEDTTSTAVAWS